MKLMNIVTVLMTVILISACGGSKTEPTLPQHPPAQKPEPGPSVEVLFHPTDPTLERIGAWLKDAHQTVDIAMYDLEAGDGSPVIAALMEESVQSRLASKTLSIRMIYEGYAKPDANAAKMAKLEALGVDVRTLTSGKKVHHKFAVIDASEPDARVITGSANWSLSSYRNYDENILFIQNLPQATVGFENEFENLWNHSTEFGNTLNHPVRVLPTAPTPNSDLEMHFNSRRHLEKEDAPENSLTTQIVQLLSAAKSEVQIATTRVRLVPVLEAIKAAGERGVHVRILLSQDDYHDLRARAGWLSHQPNIELRVKFYNLKPGNYMVYQMHNKFMVVDGQTLLTGSFNWSDSSENSHVENVVILKGETAAQVLPKYTERFEMLWERGRDTLPSFRQELMTDRALKITPHCGFKPISLSQDEAKELLRLAPTCAE